MQKNRLSRRGFLKLSTFTTVGAALAACQVATPPEDGATQQAADSANAIPAAAAVTVNFWDFPFYSVDVGEPGFWQEERAAAFMAENPDVEVSVLPLTWEQMAKVNTSIAAGSPPEVVGGGWIQLTLEALKLGLALDLTDSLEQQLTSDLISGMLEQCSIDGRVYMLPYWPVCQSAVVYLDVAQEANALDLTPQPACYDWNIDQFNAWLEAMRGTRPDGSERYGLGIPSARSTPAGHWITYLFFRSFGAVFWTDETESCVNFATPEAIKCLDWMQMLAKDDLIPNPAGYIDDDNNSLIAQGNIAMQLGTAVPGAARQEGNVLDPETLIIEDTVNNRQWRFVQYPHDDPHPAVVWGGANYSGLVPFKPKDEATIPGLTRFLHWMTNSESEEWLVKTAGHLPFRKSILDEVEDDRLILYTSECLMPNAWFDGKKNAELLLIRTIFEEHFQDAWGGKSAEQVLQETTEDVNSALQTCM